MSDQDSKYLGRKYSCPGCQSKLKFTRPPTSQLLSCPNCRRRLKLQNYAAAASKDEMLKEAIKALVESKVPDVEPYDYRKDLRLDHVDCSTAGVWKFDQPWPESVHEVVVESAEVLFNPLDTCGVVRARRLLLDGKFRRVTVFRTGQVEEIQVNGHWWDIDLHEGKLGLLSREVVRKLNQRIVARQFAARINRMQQVTRQGQEFLELFVDVAIDESNQKKTRVKLRYR